MRCKMLIFCSMVGLSACHGSSPDSAVEQWWYTEKPQGYTEQGTAIIPAGSPLPTAGGAKGTHAGDKR